MSHARTITMEGTGYYGGRTPLQSAINTGHIDMVRLLLEHGADVNGQDDAGTTALMWAVTDHHYLSAEAALPIARLLLQHGADVNRTDLEGSTALDAASFRERQPIFDLLEQAGAVRGWAES